MQYHNFDIEEEKFPLYQAFSISSEELSKLQSYFLPLIQNTTQSKVFNTQTKENEYHPEIRNSIVTKTSDINSFAMLANTMDQINAQIKETNTMAQLVCNEIDIIKYEADGHFGKHRDFVNFISDQMKCYALIICLEGTEEGGETQLHFSDINNKVIQETRIAGGCLLFRNELVHESNEVISGNKIIIKANIRCFKEYEPDTDFNEVILIEFPDDKRCYVLYDFMYKQYDQSIFVLNRNFKKSNKLTLKNMTFEQFAPVYNFLKGEKIILSESKDTFDYLGIIDPKITVLTHYESNLIKKLHNKMDEFYDFLGGGTNLWFIKSFEDYTYYKNVLKTESNIVPIQMMVSFNDKRDGRIQQICIHDCIPIKVITSDEYLDYYLEPSNNDINISSLRLFMNKVYRCNRTFGSNEFDNPTDLNAFINLDDIYDSDCEDNECNNCGNVKRNQKLIQSTNEYEYLKELMNLYFEMVYSRYNDDCVRENELPITRTKFPTKINIQELIKTIKCIKENVSFDDISYNKNISFKDYTADAYHCNESTYYLHHANIYFGFINLS